MLRTKLQSGSWAVIISPEISGPPLNNTEGPSEKLVFIARDPNSVSGTKVIVRHTNSNFCLILVLDLIIILSAERSIKTTIPKLRVYKQPHLLQLIILNKVFPQ